MGEVDTTFIVKRFYTVAGLNRPWIEEFGEFDADTFLEIIPDHKKRMKSNQFSDLTLDGLVRGNFNVHLALDEDGNYVHNSMKKMSKHLAHMEFLHRALSLPEKDNIFYDTYPIFIAGETISEGYNKEKLGLDPFSNLHFFSTLLLEEIIDNIDPELIQKVRFVYVQPETWIQKPVLKDGYFGLQEVMKEIIEEKINPNVSGIEFGTLEKFDDSSPKFGNSWYKPEVVSKKEIKKQIDKTPELKAEETKNMGEIQPEYFEEKMGFEIEASLEAMAIKYADILEKAFIYSYKKYSSLGFSGIPLHMEKTSPSFEIIKRTKHYASEAITDPITGELKTINTGGKYGPLAGLDKPEMGICEPRAIARLLGLLNDIEAQEKKEYVSKVFNIKIPSAKMIEFVSMGKYSNLLLERGTENRHPNLHDLADYAFYEATEESGLSERHKEHMDSQSWNHRVGFSRKEPRLVEIFNSNRTIYDGIRKDSKKNLRWFPEFKDKKIVTADKLIEYSPLKKDFFSMDGVLERGINVESDFRASELSLPGNPSLSNDYFLKVMEGKADVGCTIQKIIGTIPQENRFALIKKALHYVGGFQKEIFLKNRDEVSFESIFAMRGTAIHHLTTEPFPNLVHYETLLNAGIEPVSSDVYSETTFMTNFVFPGRYSLQELSFSMHPDAYLFFHRGGNSFDLFINDTKTNRVTHYPEHKYTSQLFSNAFIIKYLVEEQMGLKIENLYIGLDKNAFYTGFQGKTNFIIPHSKYRGMKTSPIMRFEKNHPFYEALPRMIGQIMEEKNELREEDYAFSFYKDKQIKCGTCKKCFDEHYLVCDYLNRESVRGRDINPALKIDSKLEDIEHLL